MSPKRILLHVDETERSEALFAVASQVARRHGASLSVLFAAPIRVPVVAAGPGAAVAIAQPDSGQELVAEKLRERLEKAVAKTGLSFDWHTHRGNVVEAITELARFADLAVVGQVPVDESPLGVPVDLGAMVALKCGRPVLVIPYAGSFPDIGKNVMVAWNGSREASRALHDSRPWLHAADTVTVLTINPPAADETPMSEMRAYFECLGVEADIKQMSGADISPEDLLLSIAADRGVDLLVMGAYGHSRVEEIVFGGATRHILKSMTVPILISH